MSKYLILKNNSNQTLVYYPVPKNANTSAKLFIAKHLKIDDRFIFIGDKIPRYLQKREDLQSKESIVRFLPSKQKFKKVNADFKCCIVRNPIKRFLSAYKNRILYHKDKLFYNHSIDQILEKLAQRSFENPHFLPQVYFLGNDIEYYNFYCDVDEINKFEIFINNFFNQKINFPKIQTGSTKEDIILTKKQIKQLEEIYEEDFRLVSSLKNN